MSERGQAPNIDTVVQGLEGQGTRISSATLAPSSRGKRLLWRGSTRTIIDGPFVEAKELVGGYAILDMASMDECVVFCDAYAKILLTVADELEIDVRLLGWWPRDARSPSARPTSNSRGATPFRRFRRSSMLARNPAFE